MSTLPNLKFHGPAASGAEQARAVAQALYQQRKPREALEQFDRALSLGADPALDLGERWICAMLLGDFSRGWRESDRLLEQGAAGVARFNAGRPLTERLVWDGRPFTGRRVLVRCHHGFGDTLQFARFLPHFRDLAGSVTLSAQPELAPLLGRLADKVITPADPPPLADVELEVMELAHALRLRPEQATPVPYLDAPAAALERERLRWRKLSGRKVGVAWKVRGFRTERSLPARELACLGAIPGVSFFCLQKDAPANEHALLQEKLRFANPEGPPASIAETTALVASLDLVVTVDTMVAHLAGALGKPVWNLLHWNGDWRWMSGREDSPWYPSMRLFRQPTPGDWSTPVLRVREELRRQAAPIW